MIVLGITGSIGMGKSMLGGMLESLAVPVHEADEAVHRLLRSDTEAYSIITNQFPHYEFPDIYLRRGPNGMREINRKALGELVFSDDEKRERLEEILHPFVRESQDDFIRKHKRMGLAVAALDIPLLFETGAEKRVDYTITVSVPEFLQTRRVLARPQIDAQTYAVILQRQMPNAEKCARSDYVVQTGLGRAETMQQIKRILREIKKNKV